MQEKKVYHCTQCGAELEHRKWNGLCAMCGVLSSKPTIDQMISKSGPAWEKWKANMRRFLDAH